MKNKFILFFLIIIGNLSVGYIIETYAQAFAISEVQAEFFSIDRFANEVYYIDRFTGEVLKRNLLTMESSLSEFTSLPAFAHNRHMAVYAKDGEMYGYDFDKDSTFLLLDNGNIKRTSNGVSEIVYPGYVISPNDNYMLSTSRTGTNYYSFAERKVYPTQMEIYGGHEWSSDTTVVIYQPGSANIILEYSFIGNAIDTLLVLDEHKEITTYSYNVSRNILAYSLYPNRIEEYIPKIYLYNKETKETVLAFHPLMDDSAEVASCWSSPVGISSLNWSKDETKLAFFSFGLTNSFSGVYIYDLDLDTTYRYTECEDYGLKYELDWYNKDTLVYVDYSTVQVFGFDATSPITSVQEIKNNERHDSEIVIKTYPNPFNNSIKIEIVGNISRPELTIYDINGRRVKTFERIETLDGREQIEWDGTNGMGRYVSSGVYFIVVSNNEGIKVSTKINFLK